jgi:hypothetical protein
MADLSTKTRKKLPRKDFALSGRRFPIEDKAHAVAAERLVGRAEKAGSISPAQAEEVKSKAAAKLGRAPNQGKTHDHGGMTFHQSMKGYHHEDMDHTSKDR